jgi:hypothetical protein
MQWACAVLYCRLWPVCLYHDFPRHVINGTIFGKELIANDICVLIFSVILSEIFLIPRKNKRDMNTNACRYSCKVPVILVIFQSNLNFRNSVSKNTHISNFTKILPVGAEFSIRMDRKKGGRTYGRRDRHTDMTK